MRGNVFTRIVYADNSPADLARLRDRFPGVEFVQPASNERPDGVHYGYSEIQLVDSALDAAGVSGRFVKATGRLTFPTLPKMLRKLDAADVAVIDCRFNYRDRSVASATQVMVFDAAWWRNRLGGRLDWFRPALRRTHAEDFIYAHVAPRRHDPGVRLRFPVNVEPVGHGAQWGEDYSSYRNKAVALARSATRALAPAIWV